MPSRLGSFIQHGPLHIYFGNASDNLLSCGTNNLMSFVALKTKLHATKLIFLKQVHGTNVQIIDSNNIPEIGDSLFEELGDALITKIPHYGLGVLTADCLPLVLFDPINKTHSVIHAGWKGLMANIIKTTINSMTKCYKTQTQHLLAFLGPAARSCCYEVDETLAKSFNQPHATRKSPAAGKLFIDLPQLAQTLLLEAGTINQNIDMSHCLCTICNKHMCSYRRQSKHAGRQATITILHKT